MKSGNPTKVVLIDGTITDNWSKEWAAECLKRHAHVQNVLRLLGKQNREQRERYYTETGHLEGPEAEKRLRAEVARQWTAERERMKESTK